MIALRLILLLFVGLAFGAFNSHADVIDACVSANHGNTRILDPYSNSTECRASENPVSWNQNGSGNGGGIVVVEDTQEYDDYCTGPPSPPPDVVATAVCPEGTVLVARDCQTSSEIPQRSDSVPGVNLESQFPSGRDNRFGPIPTSLAQSTLCTLICQVDLPPGSGITGSITAVAYCEPIPQP